MIGSLSLPIWQIRVLTRLEVWVTHPEIGLGRHGAGGLCAHRSEDLASSFRAVRAG